ncbi:MAG: hypothetical protein HY882_04650 [Deltaproteobacteria bacterium]|nr:hypothetical protein [Deltaproteobacteria bacterium]
MKKLAILILTLAILGGWLCSAYAAELLGYPIVPKQAKFYTIILSVVGTSIGLVSAVYLSFWLADLKKRR